MGPYHRRGRKKGKALGAAVSTQLEGLRNLARDLNSEGSPGGDPVPGTFADAANFATRAAEARREAAAVIEATFGTSYPKVPDDAAGLFNTLADRTPLHYVAGLWRPEDAGQYFITTGGGHAVLLRSSTPQGVWVALLADFLTNPQRDRLRRCPVCRRWFVDETRNRSARRCSRTCTIAWSNAQRGQKRKEAMSR
jgi:hypothetical protein